ncbi:hypothetical protein HBI37_170790 [Parastagonospora nodorum]|nr:hypothetical protein HBI37_170790 [Parastagonospora nodorum]
MDRFCTICSFQPKTYAGLAKHTLNETYTSLSNEYNTAQDRKVHVCAADGLSSTVTVYNHIKKDKNADLAIANSISDALDMCAKDDLVRRKSPLSTSTQTWELQRIKCTLEDVNSLFADARLHNLHTRLLFQSGRQYHRPFADELVYALSQFFLGNTDYPVRWWNIQQSLLDRVTVVLIIILVNKTQLSLILGDRSTPSTLLAEFIPTTKIRNPLLKSQVYYYCIGKLLSPLENAAKSGILLACADRRIRQCYLTICAILADYEEQVLLTSVKKNCYYTRCTKHYNFNIHVSLATDTLHLLLKGLVIKMLDFMQDMLDDIYPSSRKTWDNSTTLVTQESDSTYTEQKAIIQQLIAVVSPLFVSKAPFALHFIRAVCDLVTLAQYKSYDEDTLAYIQGALERMNVFKEEFRVYQRTLGEEKNFNYLKALDSICTRANSEAHHITMVKQFYSMTNKKEYILQICLHNSQRTVLLAANYATVVKQSRPSTTDRLDVDLSWVGCMSVQIHSSIKCWRSSGKRHNDPEHCDEEVVRCAPNWQQTGLWRRDYVWVQEFEHGDNRRQSRTVTDGRVVAQLHLILTIINYTCYDKDGKHMAYIGAFSKVLLFNNNEQIDNTTGMLTFKFYDLSTIIRLVHLVPRDLPNLTTHTTMSYYVNNYINWDEYNRLYSLTFNIDLLRTLREYRRKRTRNN